MKVEPSCLKSFNSTFAWFGAVVFALALSACGQPRSTSVACQDSSQCDANQYCDRGLCKDTTFDPTSFCARDTDCKDNEFCDGGSCAERQTTNPTNDACTQTQDCSIGEHCKLVSGTCVKCLNDDHCEIGFVCTSAGTCGTESESCTSDNDCAGLKCDDAGLCVQCINSGDCPNSQSCRNQQCVVQGGGGATCSSAADCASTGKICDSSASVCRDCTADTECGTGKRCSAGTCTIIPTGGEECLFRSDCNGLACSLDGICQPCVNDFMCLDLTDLFTGTTTICNTSSGQCVAPECTYAEDCSAGQACFAGRCGECWDDNECRAGEYCDAAGVCQTPAPTPARTFGQTCSTANECATGLTCLNMNGQSLCSRPCIGSGKGGDNDCPSTYACYDFDSGALDGSKMCVAAAQAGSSYPGHGFTQLPGAACSASNNKCQTSTCFSETNTCARACLANRDCNSGEVCYAEWLEVGTSGNHFCYGSDLANYRAAGASCNEGWECDSGLCGGTCNDGTTCNSSDDCTTGVCTGSCMDHCRSNSDCPSGDACAPFPTYYSANTGYGGYVPACMDKYYTGTAANGASCSSHSQCGSDWCVGGICTTPCGTKADCTGALSTTSCQLRSFVDSGGDPVYAMSFCQ